MMGGWELAIPQTSQNKQLAWELLTITVDPKIISLWLEQNGFLPNHSYLLFNFVTYYTIKIITHLTSDINLSVCFSWLGLLVSHWSTLPIYIR
jgi:ABC-type glycerol-3-phosphate transport system substrate-binding protein